MAKRENVITKLPRSTEKKRKKNPMSLKGNLYAITSYIRRSKDPVLLDQTKSLLKKIFQLIDSIIELEKENEITHRLLKKYEKEIKRKNRWTGL
jgi:hypothetical protein